METPNAVPLVRYSSSPQYISPAITLAIPMASPRRNAHGGAMERAQIIISPKPAPIASPANPIRILSIPADADGTIEACQYGYMSHTTPWRTP